ncbi:MAG: hypothetical protein FJ109_01400 [Deltaproteobacteria bacterium]|nr:hypothetical protein [Deltaproteobacteria bacterium]
MKLTGTLLLLGDHVNTDLIHPPAFYSTRVEESVKGAFAGLGLEAGALGPPPYLVAGGINFGCGSSRESTMRALRQAGVAALLARSFAHIFRRSAWALGIPALVLDGVLPPEVGGRSAVVDPALGLLHVEGLGKLPLRPPEPYELDLAEAGGLLPFLEASDWHWRS